MNREDEIEIRMLTASMVQTVAYRESDPGGLKSIATVLMDWAHADEDGRRSIYHKWRNAGPAGLPPQQ